MVLGGKVVIFLEKDCPPQKCLFFHFGPKIWNRPDFKPRYLGAQEELGKKLGI